MVIVVLGMHASGTSLVANALRVMGINMGRTFAGPVKGIPVWEDVDFVKINAALLAKASGNWSNPPPPEAILAVGSSDRLRRLMQSLVYLRENTTAGAWGWKDPRNCLTVPLWHPLLTDPHYVYVKRDAEAVARSLLERGPSSKTRERWLPIIRDYNGRVRWFLAESGAPKFEMEFDRLVNRATADQVFEGLARWLGLKNEGKQVERALQVVKFRD